MHLHSDTSPFSLRVNFDRRTPVTVSFGDRYRVGQLTGVTDSSTHLGGVAVYGGISLPHDTAHVVRDQPSAQFVRR